MQVPRPDLDAVLSALTPREKQIVGLVAAGRPNKVIAIDLGISLRTAEAHRARIFTKLDARNAMELACQLCAHGRSGASPILNEAARYVLNEPSAAYGPPQGAVPPLDSCDSRAALDSAGVSALPDLPDFPGLSDSSDSSDSSGSSDASGPSWPYRLWPGNHGR